MIYVATCTSSFLHHFIQVPQRLLSNSFSWVLMLWLLLRAIGCWRCCSSIFFANINTKDRHIIVICFVLFTFTLLVEQPFFVTLLNYRTASLPRVVSVHVANINNLLIFQYIEYSISR